MTNEQRFTKKEEWRVLDKFIKAMHGEDKCLSFKIMTKILKIEEFDGLSDLKRKYRMEAYDQG